MMGKLEYKLDWEVAKARWASWWKREKTDGLLLGIQAPRKEALPIRVPLSINANYISWWLDFDSILNRAEIDFARTVYLEGAFPCLAALLGPGSMGVFLGAEPVFDSTTIWYKPYFSDIHTAELKLDKKSRWWQWTLDITRRMIEHSRDRYIVGMPDLIENLDTIAAFFGTEKLLCYLCDCSREVHRLQEQLLPLWFNAYDELYELIKDSDGGNAFYAFMVWASWTGGKTSV